MSEPKSGTGPGPAPARWPLSAPPVSAARQAEEAGATSGKDRKDKGKKNKKKKKARFGSDRGIETMFRTSYRTHIDMSGLADNKANIMITINGLILSITLASISPKIDANPWLLLPTSVLLLGCLVSMIYAVLAARPRVTHRALTLEDVRRNRANILFFGNFINLREDEFIEGMGELLQNTDSLYVNMIRDIYSLGLVLDRKFRFLRVSYNVFMFGLIAAVALFISVLTMVVVVGGGTVTPV